MSAKRYGATALAIQQEKTRWMELHPGKPLPRDLYRADLRYNKETTPPPKAAVEALLHVHPRYDTRLTQSWQYENNITREPGDDTERIRADLGLSNGAYRAGNVRHDKQPVDNFAGMRARVIWRPGTLAVRLKGMNAQKPRTDTERGIIRKLSRQALNRHLAHLRELEARDFKAQHMATLTYPSNWAAALCDTSGPVRLIREGWARLENLRAKTKPVRDELRRNPRNGQAQWVFEYLSGEMRECRKLIKSAVIECRKLGPNGQKVKKHLSAWYKRFDRKFGTQVLETHLCWGKAHKAAKEWRDLGTYVDVKVRRTDDKKERWEVYAVLYRTTHWLEFQRRGAPHIHMIFFDCRGIDWDAVREWAGHSWAATVAGLRSAKQYLPAENPKVRRAMNEYDELRELWGKKAADGFLREQIEAAGLDWGVFNHVRAGTQMAAALKQHFGYAAKEASKYNSKKYQALVPKNYRRVGRWWGYRKYKREEVQKLEYEIWHSPDELQKCVLDPLNVALKHMPPGCHRFRKKLERFYEGIRNHVDYGYITLWGEGPRIAFLNAIAEA